jgi:CRISPR/Cas system Type II protein with McrA/HNH and RuvC-like nuclease domain
MAKSIQQFFVHDAIIEADTINLQRRTLLEHTSREFVNFIDYYQFTDQDHKEEKPKGFYLLEGKQTNELDKKHLYNQFLEAYPEYTKIKNYSQNKFTKWLKLYSQSSDLIAPLTEYSERRSNGKDFITFKSK